MMTFACSVCSFGGGPAVNHLYMCAICQVEIEALAKRRKTEIDTFIKVGDGSPRSCACHLCGCQTLTKRLFDLACSSTKSFRLRRLPLSSCASACSGSGSGRALSKAKTTVRSCNWAILKNKKQNIQTKNIFFSYSINAVPTAEPPGPIDNSKIGVMKGGHLQLKQGKKKKITREPFHKRQPREK